ncbi:MAG TPA: hypothetical protein VMY16_02990 [Ilumatobacteraceae bacterium]|nr:hypothetical protein [Ilumatobacteraceae bacterium]
MGAIIFTTWVTVVAGAGSLDVFGNGVDVVGDVDPQGLVARDVAALPLDALAV